VISFWVAGVPVQQGSKIPGVTKKGVPYLRESTDRKLRPWRAAVEDAASAAMVGQPMLKGPVGLSVEFYFPIVASDRERFWKHTAPDLSKLVRAVEDAITNAGVWEDDARVVEYGTINKTHHETPGAQISVWQVDPVVSERKAA
jgi:Holliday junction resolvase RusA-like endonuclease